MIDAGVGGISPNTPLTNQEVRVVLMSFVLGEVPLSTLRAWTSQRAGSPREAPYERLIDELISSVARPDFDKELARTFIDRLAWALE